MRLHRADRSQTKQRKLFRSTESTSPKFRITQRIAFVHSLTAGKTVLEYEPHGAAAREIVKLCTLVCKHDYSIT